ncbi:hypothetical protein ACKWTF_016169 [Chironomus riparius]
MNSSNIFSSLSPFHTILKYTGALIFTIDSRNSTVVVTKWNYFAILLIILSNALLGCSYWTMDFFFSFTIQVADKSEPFLIFMDHFICIFTIYWIFRHRHGVLRILIILNEVDEIYKDNGIDIYHESFRKKTFIATAFCCLYAGSSSTFVAYIMGLYSTLSGITLALFTIWIYWLSLSFQLHYGFMVFAISIRCRTMVIWIQKHPFSLKNISRIHLRLVEVMKLFNSIFSQIIMLFIGTLFSWNCFCAFALTIARKSTLNEFITSVALLSNLVFSTILLVCVVRYCERILESKEMMIESLYFVKNKASKVGCENDEEISGLINQILHTNIRVRCNFFDINWKFLFHFLAASIMYLFILIQYEDYLNTRNGARSSESPFQ